MARRKAPRMGVDVAELAMSTLSDALHLRIVEDNAIVVHSRAELLNSAPPPKPDGRQTVTHHERGNITPVIVITCAEDAESIISSSPAFSLQVVQDNTGMRFARRNIHCVTARPKSDRGKPVTHRWGPRRPPGESVRVAELPEDPLPPTFEVPVVEDSASVSFS